MRRGVRLLATPRDWAAPRRWAHPCTFLLIKCSSGKDPRVSAVIARSSPQSKEQGAKDACARARMRGAWGVRRPPLSQERVHRTVEYVIRARLRSMTKDCCSVTFSVSVATADAMCGRLGRRAGEE